VDDLLKDITGAVQGQAGQTGQAGQMGGPLGELLGGLMGSGGLGSGLGAAGTGGTAGVTGLGGSANPAGGLAALGTLLPAILGVLGGQAGTNQTGLHQIVNTMQANGLGNIAQSWIGNGASQAITPAQVDQVLSPSQLSDLAAKSGLPPDQLKSSIAAILPHLVSGLSPSGSMPEPAQVQAAVGQIQHALGGLPGEH
jgi:uncharacterized protein YidB (DUF937 family)